MELEGYDMADMERRLGGRPSPLNMKPAYMKLLAKTQEITFHLLTT